MNLPGTTMNHVHDGGPRPSTIYDDWGTTNPQIRILFVLYHSPPLPYHTSSLSTRGAVTKIFIQDSEVSLERKLPCDLKAMLCFWNAASHTDVFEDNPTAAGRQSGHQRPSG